MCCDPPVTPLTPRRGPLVSPRGGASVVAPFPLVGGGVVHNHHSLTDLEGVGGGSTNYDEYLR